MPTRNFGFAALIALAACATSEPAPVASAQTPPAAAHAQVDTTVFVPPPPTANGALEAAELAIVRGPWTDARRAQAAEDNAADPFAAFDAVLGPGFNGDNLPATTTLLTRVGRASGFAGEAAKARYRRQRPFMTDSTITPCIPADDRLRASFSYPSGHGALGFGWALVLAELIPSHGDAIIERGRDFGWSRVVCGLHYPSDIDAARVVAAAVIARLHTDPEFQQEMEAARAELSRIYH